MSEKENFLTIKENGTSELIIKKSRFIANIARTTTTDAANDFIQKMDLYLQANDGGSSYYVSKDGFTSQKIYLALCNSLPGNGGIHDIFIDDNEEDILDYCVAR